MTLIGRLRAGDEIAWEQMTRIYYPQVYARWV